MIVITLNGPDNVGKTTHARWLNRLIKGSINLETISNWNSNWQKLNDNNFSNWWFNQVSSEELFELIFESYINRKKHRKGDVVIEDRGLPMLSAVCAATHSIKFKVPVVESIRYVRQFLLSKKIVENKDVVNVLLLHEETLEKCSELSCLRDLKESSDIYKKYQEYLGSILRLQLAEGLYEVCVIRGDKSIAEVNTEIIDFIKRKNPNVQAANLQAVGNIKILAGWSESGKSTTARIMQLNSDLTRLKIDWILKTAATKKGISNPYDWDEEIQAEEIINELLNFKILNPFVNDFIIESAHRFNQVIHLKNVLGDKITLIWVEADLLTRKFRSCYENADLLAKDLIKWNRGMGNLKPKSDIIISNTGTLFEFEENVRKTLMMGNGSSKPFTKNIENYILPKEIKDWLFNLINTIKEIETVKMVTLTGSAEANRWTQNWSDLDVLIVCEDTLNERLIYYLKHLPPLEGIKIAFTRVSIVEMNVINLEPRILNAFYLLTNKMACVLYQTSCFLIPNISANENRKSSLTEFPFAVVALRRLLIDEPFDFKKVYKKCLVVLKILLRAEYIFLDKPLEVISMYNNIKNSSLPLLTPEYLISLTEKDASNQTVYMANSILKSIDLKAHKMIKSGKEKVRGILIIGNSIVLIKRTIADLLPYFVFPGGTVEHFDLNNLDALFRELYEEIEAEVSVLCPLFVLQNKENIETFWLCNLREYSKTGGKGEEFSNSARGLYEIIEVPLDRETILAYNIKPEIIKDKIVELIPAILKNKNISSFKCEWIDASNE